MWRAQESDVIYTDGPFAKEEGFLEEVEDFLPSPKELANAGQMVRITLILPLETLAYFKKYAQEKHASYHEMMQQVFIDFVNVQEAKANKIDEVIAT